MVLSDSLPTLGAGTLKDRDDPKLFGTSKVCFLCKLFCSLFHDISHRNPISFSPPFRSTRRSPSTAQGVRFRSTCSFSLVVIRTLPRSVRFRSRQVSSDWLMGSAQVVSLATPQDRPISTPRLMLLARRTLSSLLTNLEKSWPALSGLKRSFVCEHHEVRLNTKL